MRGLGVSLTAVLKRYAVLVKGASRGWVVRPGSTWRLLAKTTGVLMEGVPSHLDYQAIGTALTQVRGVTGVHDLHVWHMSAQHAALSAHVAIDDGDAWPRILGDARAMLASRFAIDHVTLQPSWPVDAPYGDRRVIPIAPAEGVDGR